MTFMQELNKVGKGAKKKASFRRGNKTVGGKTKSNFWMESVVKTQLHELAEYRGISMSGLLTELIQAEYERITCDEKVELPIKKPQ